MNKNYLKPAILSLVFVLAMIFFGVSTNKVNIDMTESMEDASLPVMYFQYGGMEINELHGYTKEMDLLSMRDSILPLGETRTLHMGFHTYDNTIEKLSYQIRSLDGSRLLMEEEDVEMQSTKNGVEYKVDLPSLFDNGEECNLVVKATVDGQAVYYYTRLMKAVNYNVSECVDFAMTFHEYTFRSDAGEFIPTYMDPATGDATTLSYVDLSCTLRQLTWAKFGGKKLTEPVVSVKEISDTFNVVVINYVMININEDNETEYYNVEEYYRLRQTPARMYVLNFERRMNQIIRGENNIFHGTSGLMLGIRDEEVQYLSNDAGNAIAFVQEGELWCYDRSSHSLLQVFSFRGIEGIDARENWDRHGIEIIRVDEAGSIDFLVYGYMNRGHHEGEVGIGVYHFDGIAHTVEEEAFLSSDKSYEALRADLSEFMYVNEQKQLFIMVSGDIYQIDLNTDTPKLIADLTDKQGFASSASNRYIAWVEADKLYSSPKIHLMDLKTGIVTLIEENADQYLMPLSFIGDDFVYGIANAREVKTDSVGNQAFPMCALKILNTSQEKREVIKTYRPAGAYIGTVTTDKQNIYVDLVNEVDGRFVVQARDTIMNRETGVTNKVYLKNVVTDLKQTQRVINMKEIATSENMNYITSIHVMNSQEVSGVELDFVPQEKTFYVYFKGEAIYASTNVSHAIMYANQHNGVVVDEKMQYIFKRSRGSSQSALKNVKPNEADANGSSIVKCVSAILEREGYGLVVNDLIAAGQTPYHILSSTMTNARVLELSECGVDELLYYVSLGNPVYAKVGAEEAVLVIGYTSSQVQYYNPSNGRIVSVDIEEMNRMFYNGGNHFVVYMK